MLILLCARETNHIRRGVENGKIPGCTQWGREKKLKTEKKKEEEKVRGRRGPAADRSTSCKPMKYFHVGYLSKNKKKY